MKLVCIYNNEMLLKAGLLSSHKAFLDNIDLLLIDNRKNIFTSFSQAIQGAIKPVDENEILIIAHQDVQFFDEKSCQIILKSVKQISHDNILLAGVAGVRRYRKYAEEGGVNKIICGGKIIDYEEIKNITKVETIDECVMITNKKTILYAGLFSDHQLGWHLYAVDACLALKFKGFSAYVLPLMINHFSMGALDKKYYHSCLRLLRKYKVKEIFTTNLRITKSRLLVDYLKFLLKKYVG